MTERLDRTLVARGLARSRTSAQELIRSGRVRVNGTAVTRPASLVGPAATIATEAERYVSRAAYKLLGALDDLAQPISGRVLDAGASTGGFTQVLLERGAVEVVAVDVGTDQLAAELRSDPRVRVWEQTSLRDLTLAHVGDRPVDLVVADVSFISLRLLAAPLTSVLAPTGGLLTLVKPQFEVGRERLGPGGVVRSAELHAAAVRGVTAAVASAGWSAAAAAPSRLPGPAGNREFFVLFRHGETSATLDLDALTAPICWGR